MQRLCELTGTPAARLTSARCGAVTRVCLIVTAVQRSLKMFAGLERSRASINYEIMIL